MRNILIPTDFSPYAYNALLYAAALSKSLNSKLFIYHTYYNSNVRTRTIFTSIEDELRDDAERQMREFTKRFTDETIASDIEFTTIINGKETVSGINNLTLKNNINLIIMGTKGASGLLGNYLGSFTSETISGAVVPVLAIPLDAAWKAPKKIVFALDPYEHYEKEYFTSFNEMVQHFKSAVHIIEVGTKDEEKKWNKGDLSTWLDNVAFFKQSMDGDDIGELINNCVIKEKADWLTLIPIPRYLFEDIFNKSISKKLVLHTKIPLLALK